MSRLARVVWSEGMHLAQHHFQTQSRYHEEAIRFALEQVCFEPRGLAAAGFDPEALRNGIVALTHARGIMPDGAPFQIPETEAPPAPLDVRAGFRPTDLEKRVLLTLPPVRPGAPNCSPDASPDCRYVARTQNLPDETTGADERPVTIGQRNFRLVLESDVGTDQVVLPVARVKREGSGGFLYDRAFIPPCLQIGASDRLMEMLGGLIELLERKAGVLVEERRSPRDSVAQYGGQDVASFWLAHAIHSALAPLHFHLITRRSHPEMLYLELARLAGALCTFSLTADPQTIPPYDHQDLEGCFSRLDRHIRDNLEVPLPTTYEKVPLHRRGVRSVFTGRVREDLCAAGTQWILAVRSEQKASRVVSSVSSKVKLASKTALPVLVRTSGMAGLGLEHMMRPPRELAPRTGWEYFLIKRSGTLWKGIRDSLEVGIWVPDELVEAEFELTVILQAEQ